MRIEIVGAESLGVRGLCCRVELAGRSIVIDPGVALGYRRGGLRPHPVQVAVGRWVRKVIVGRLRTATDVVLSHFHGDHVPLADANPYQLSFRHLPSGFSGLRCWCPSPHDLSAAMRERFAGLERLCGDHLTPAEGRRAGPLSFSTAVAHGSPGSGLGTVMMTRIDSGRRVFVHAADIQLLDDEAVDRILDWRADVVLAAGPPLYLEQLGAAERESAWHNALRLAKGVGTLILDHHLMRSAQGPVWLAALADRTGRRVCCAADFMRRPRRLLEAERPRWYRRRPVAAGWHDRYESGMRNLSDDEPAERVSAPQPP